jgi:hypothetical protein
MSRTHKKNWRIYVDGFDMSGYGFGIGPLAHTAEPVGETPLTDALHGQLPGVNTVSIGTLNTVFDNTVTVGSHIVLKTIGGSRVVSVAIGDVDAPAAGDPCFAGQFTQLNYRAAGEGMVTTTIDFGPDAVAASLLYTKPWGHIIHAKAEETGVNTGEGDHENLAGQTTAGGFMTWHLEAADGTGTVTMSIEDDEATDGTYASLVATAAIDVATAPIGGVKILDMDATVDTFTRWQVAFGGNTTEATFFISFHRG